MVPPHGLPTRFTISTISRQTVKTRISCSLKRFPRTTGQKTVTTCTENVLTRTPKLVVTDFSMYKTSPGGGGASGGSLRSSRQAVACHPFTRSWATMPPEAPPPPGPVRHMDFPRLFIPDGHSMIRVSVCSISEQVGMSIFG